MIGLSRFFFQGSIILALVLSIALFDSMGIGALLAAVGVFFMVLLFLI